MKLWLNLVLNVDFSFCSMYNLLCIGICGGSGDFVDSDALQTDYLVWKMIPAFVSSVDYLVSFEMTSKWMNGIFAHQTVNAFCGTIYQGSDDNENLYAV